MVMVRAPQNLVDGYGANSARSSHRKVARLKTQHLYGSAGTAILFRTPSRAPDSFISMPPYVQNEGMPEPCACNRTDARTPSDIRSQSDFSVDFTETSDDIC